MFSARSNEKFIEEDIYQQHSRTNSTSESKTSSESVNLSKLVTQLLIEQLKETESKSVFDLINNHPETRLFFLPDEGKDKALHEALKNNSQLIKLLDNHISDIEQCEKADILYDKVTSVVKIFFDPIKKTDNWKTFWKKQSRKTELANTSWHENLVAGCFLFVLISIWENSQVKISGLITARETSALMKTVNLVLCNPSKTGFMNALKKDLKNSVKNLSQTGHETHKEYETIKGVRDTLNFRLCPNSEALAVSEAIKLLQQHTKTIEGLQKFILESPAMQPVESPTLKLIVGQKKTPPLQLSAIVPEKLRTSGSPERSPQRDAHSMPEKKQTPRRSAGRGRSSSGTSPRVHKEISETRSDIPTIQATPPPPTNPQIGLNFFQPQLDETESNIYQAPAPQ